MLKLASRLPARSQKLLQYPAFSSSASKNSLRPPLNLDPSLQALLKDVDISLKQAKVETPPPIAMRELEVLDGISPAHHEFSMDDWAPLDSFENKIESEQVEERKSPAALFGSQRIGMVILPLELQSAINLLIADGNKSQIRSDAKRLFQSNTEDTEESVWDTKYEQNYRSKIQAFRHSSRDGTAFASIALPAHYSAIMSVLHQVKGRLAPDWEMKRIIDWGSGTGSGLWASLHSFQKAPTNQIDDEHVISAINSTITSYLGVDKREGLVSIGKKLVASTPIGDLNVQWKKTFKQEDVIQREEGHDTIALSAFMLTSLSSHVAQKNLVKEMWDSGALTIILIDHNTKDGFEAIAHARQYMLEMGKKELEDPEAVNWPIRGCHVLAPCPHDHACPLLHAGGISLICGFSQRIQRPSFVRLTKRSGIGHEDIQYSYVVIQRGARPDRVDTKIGRIGEIGKRALAAERLSKIPIKELEVHVEGSGSTLPSEIEIPQPPLDPDHGLSPSEIQAGLRSEAYQWPRLIFPPLKKSGHAILDACTVDGKIMRLTIPKSQGKQPFYDARKSSWGDIFPHPPKNRALERFVPVNSKKPSSGGDIGKRRDSHKHRESLSYQAVIDTIKEKRKVSKREYALSRESKVWEDD
ncbi:Rsm22-domain-containing protein [Phlegmacium glaucopus]|nr:Rsm22-domain-containing protein [Phlegmacium glaucopus]